MRFMVALSQFLKKVKFEIKQITNGLQHPPFRGQELKSKVILIVCNAWNFKLGRQCTTRNYLHEEKSIWSTFVVASVTWSCSSTYLDQIVTRRSMNYFHSIRNNVACLNKMKIWITPCPQSPALIWNGDHNFDLSILNWISNMQILLLYMAIFWNG